MSQSSHSPSADDSVEPQPNTVDVTERADAPAAAGPNGAAAAGPGYRHPFLIYSALRFGLLLIAGVVCYLLGARGILLILLAFLISAIASFILLVPQRDAVGQRTGAYFRRLNQRIEDSKTAEDDLVDEQAANDAAQTDGSPEAAKAPTVQDSPKS